MSGRGTDRGTEEGEVGGLKRDSYGSGEGRGRGAEEGQ